MDEKELKMEELDSVSGGSAGHPENDTGEDMMTQCRNYVMVLKFRAPSGR